MNNLETGLAAIKEVTQNVTRIVELRAQGKSINQIVGIVLAEQMQKVITDLVGAQIAETPAVQPQVSPGWVACIDGATPMGLHADDKVEVRSDIGNGGATLCAGLVTWERVVEWRLKPDNSVRAHEDQGYVQHTGSDGLPCARHERVDVTFDNGRQVYGVYADDVDWKYAKYYRICAPTA
jgi:hypothetical protein